MVELKPCCKMRFQPAVDAIEEILRSSRNEKILVAIDGKCGSGKTTLGQYLHKQFESNLFHMDHFFLRTEQRTDARMKEIGGNVDYERFQEEVLLPINIGKEIQYRIFNCMDRTMGEPERIVPKQLNIIEGSYSMHPYFQNPYRLRIFMEIETETQRNNIRIRNGEEKLQLFENVWIPKENDYFAKFHVKEQADLVIEWEKK